jgi:hypothetical protein
MSWKAEAHRTYEQRVVNDSLARLAERIDVKGLPFSDRELQTLARRARESFRNPERKRERLVSYKAHLAKSYGTDLVEHVSSALEDINNAIGYEEK